MRFKTHKKIQKIQKIQKRRTKKRHRRRNVLTRRHPYPTTKNTRQKRRTRIYKGGTTDLPDCLGIYSRDLTECDTDLLKKYDPVTINKLLENNNRLLDIYRKIFLTFTDSEDYRKMPKKVREYIDGINKKKLLDCKKTYSRLNPDSTNVDTSIKGDLSKLNPEYVAELMGLSQANSTTKDIIEYFTGMTLPKTNTRKKAQEQRQMYTTRAALELKQTTLDNLEKKYNDSTKIIEDKLEDGIRFNRTIEGNNKETKLVSMQLATIKESVKNVIDENNILIANLNDPNKSNRNPYDIIDGLKKINSDINKVAKNELTKSQQKYKTIQKTKETENESLKKKLETTQKTMKQTLQSANKIASEYNQTDPELNTLTSIKEIELNVKLKGINSQIKEAEDRLAIYKNEYTPLKQKSDDLKATGKKLDAEFIKICKENPTADRQKKIDDLLKQSETNRIESVLNGFAMYNKNNEIRTEEEFLKNKQDELEKITKSNSLSKLENAPNTMKDSFKDDRLSNFEKKEGDQMDMGFDRIATRPANLNKEAAVDRLLQSKTDLPAKSPLQFTKIIDNKKQFIIPAENYVDLGASIEVGNKRYNNRCLLLTLTSKLMYKNNNPNDINVKNITKIKTQASINLVQLTKRLHDYMNYNLHNKEEIKDGLGQGISYAEVKKFDDCMTNVSGVDAFRNFIDSKVFFKIYCFDQLYKTGLIICPVMQWNNQLNYYTLDFTKDINQGGSNLNNGVYIYKINENGEQEDFDENTPIIYNWGQGHFVSGVGKSNTNLINMINNNREKDEELIRSLLAPILIPSDDKNDENIEKFLEKSTTKETMEKMKKGVKGICKFEQGQQIIFNKKKYIIIDARSRPISNEVGNEMTAGCNGYVVCNIDNPNPVISWLESSDALEASNEITYVTNDSGDQIGANITDPNRILTIIRQNGQNQKVTYDKQANAFTGFGSVDKLPIINIQ